MTRTKLILAVAALATTFATQAFALNPQPLPPIYAGPVHVHVAIPCCNGKH